MRQLFKSREETQSWLKKMEVINYTIHDDLTVDVKGSVYLTSKKLKTIPVRFGTVDGDFFCDDNKLSTLVGTPSAVGGRFECYENFLLSLDGAPSSVGGDFDCDFSGADLRKHLRSLFDEGREFSAANLILLCAEIRAEVAAKAMASAVGNATEAPAVSKRKATRS